MSQYYINPTTAVVQPSSFTHIPESVRRQMESEADRKGRYTGLHGSQGYRVNIERAKHEHRSARTNDSSQVFSALDMDTNLAHQRHVEQMFSCQPSQQPTQNCQSYGYPSTIQPVFYSPPIPLPVADAEKDRLRAQVCALEAQLRALTVQAQEQDYAGRNVEFNPAVCQHIPSYPASAPAAVSDVSPPQTVRFACTHTPAVIATTPPAPAHVATVTHDHNLYGTALSQPQDARIDAAVVEPPLLPAAYPPPRGRAPSRMAWPPVEATNAPPTRTHAQRSRSASRARSRGAAEEDAWLTSSQAAAQEVVRATSRNRCSLTPAQEHALVARLYRQPPVRTDTGIGASGAPRRQPFRPPGRAAPAACAARPPTYHARAALPTHARVPPTPTATRAHALAAPARLPSPRATAHVAPALFPVAADVLPGQCGVLDPRALHALLPAQEPPCARSLQHIPSHCAPLPDVTVVAPEPPQLPHVRLPLPLPVSASAPPEADVYGDLRAATARNKQRNTASSVFSHTAPADVPAPAHTSALAVQHTHATAMSADASSVSQRDCNRDRNRASSAFAFADGAEPARPRSRTPATPHVRVGALGQSVYEQTMGVAPAAVGEVCRQQRATLLANRARNLSSSAFADAAQVPQEESQLQPPLGSPTRRCAPIGAHELANHAAHTARARAASTASLSANRARSVCSSAVADVLCPRPARHPADQGQGNVYGASSSISATDGAVHTHQRPYTAYHERVALGFAALPPSPPSQPPHTHTSHAMYAAAASHDRAHHLCLSDIRSPAGVRTSAPSRSPPPFDIDPTLDAFADAEAERRLRSAPPLRPSPPPAPRRDPWGVVVDAPPRSSGSGRPPSPHDAATSASGSAHTGSRAHTQRQPSVASALVLRRHQLKREAAAGNPSAAAMLDALCRAPPAPVPAPAPTPVPACAPVHALSRQSRSAHAAASAGPAWSIPVHAAAHVFQSRRGSSAAGLGVASMAFTVAGPSTPGDDDTQPLPPAALDVSAAHLPTVRTTGDVTGDVMDEEAEMRSACVEAPSPAAEAARTRLRELLGSLAALNAELDASAAARSEALAPAPTPTPIATSAEAVVYALRARLASQAYVHDEADAETSDNGEYGGDGEHIAGADSWWEVGGDEDEHDEDASSDDGCGNDHYSYQCQDQRGGDGGADGADGSLQLEALLREAEATLAEAR